MHHIRARLRELIAAEMTPELEEYDRQMHQNEKRCSPAASLLVIITGGVLSWGLLFLAYAAATN